MRPGILNQERLSRILLSRLEEIRHSLERMESSPSVKEAWERIETPLAIDFEKTVVWGKERLEEFRNVSLTNKSESSAGPS
jgi:hypothetical protein